MASYQDVQKAVRAQKFNVWKIWALCGVVWLIGTRASKGVPYLDDIMLTGCLFGGPAATIAALIFTARLQKITDRKRDEVLQQELDRD